MIRISSEAPPEVAADASVPPLLVVEAGTGALSLREIWEYRELLGFFVWRDLKIRYKQATLGVAWAVLQPVLSMAVFSLFFGYLARMPSDGAPYPLFVFAALLPWQLFAYALTESSTSLVQNQHLLTKIYFPRILLPVAAVGAGLVDFILAFLALVGLMFFYGIAPTGALLALPLLVVLVIATALAVGIWLSALNVEYRDVRHALPFLTQLWFFATPIAYSGSLVPERFRFLLGLNPMAGVVEGFRWSLLGTGHFPATLLVVSSIAVLVVLGTGIAYFRRMEGTFADVV